MSDKELIRAHLETTFESASRLAKSMARHHKQEITVKRCEQGWEILVSAELMETIQYYRDLEEDMAFYAAQQQEDEEDIGVRLIDSGVVYGDHSTRVTYGD